MGLIPSACASINTKMISINESIDFEFFELKTSSAVPKRKTSQGSESTARLLELWEIDSGSLRYAGSHASLINSLAFEMERKEEMNAGKKKQEVGGRRAQYNEIKRTVALSSEQSALEPLDSDDPVSFVELDTNTTEPVDTNRKQGKVDENDSKSQNETVDKSENNGKNGNIYKSENNGKNENTDKSENNGKNETNDNNGKHETVDKSENNGKNGNIYKSENNGKNGNTDKSENNGKNKTNDNNGKHETVYKSENNYQNETVEKCGNNAKNDKSENYGKNETAEAKENRGNRLANDCETVQNVDKLKSNKNEHEEAIEETDRVDGIVFPVDGKVNGDEQNVNGIVRHAREVTEKGNEKTDTADDLIYKKDDHLGELHEELKKSHVKADNVDTEGQSKAEDNKKTSDVPNGNKMERSTEEPDKKSSKRSLYKSDSFSDNSQYDEIYLSNQNQITTIVEVHAVNDLFQNDDDFELDIANDSLMPGLNYENDTDLEISKYEICEDRSEKNDDQNCNAIQYKRDDLKTDGDGKISFCDFITSSDNDRKKQSQGNVPLKNYSNDTEDLFQNETQILINDIKNYNPLSIDVAQAYSYDAIEKKIQSANKHIINVKAVIPNTEAKQKETEKGKSDANKTRILENIKTIDCSTHLNRQPKLQTYNQGRKEAMNRGQNTSRKELPSLKTQKTKIETKLIKTGVEKIPQIKTEATFDMKLLIKAINDLETAKPKLPTRTSSARSSETSRKSKDSRKSTGSNKSHSKRPNMSFSKEEAKKIDLENQILLKKIMNQKPQPPPDNKHQIRRKPTAYINRVRLQDRISHDNTILERKLMSINKRKERISIL